MKILDADYGQRYLLPPSIEDWVSADHPARFIREMVSQMNLAELGIKEQVPIEGRPPYANELLLRVWLYGYWKRIRTSRKLEQACKEDVGFIWLCGCHRPDHNTLWRFFDRNRNALRSVFKQTVRTAMQMDLVGLVLQAVDGTKIQALCSGWKSYRVEDLEHLEEELGKHLDQLEKQLEEANKAERTADAALPKELTGSSELREKIREALSEARQSGRKHVHPHEQQARRMQCDSGNRFGYNAQAVVDQKHQIIVAEDVTEAENDHDQLNCMCEQAKENTGEKALTLADSGYSNGKELKSASENGHDVLVNLQPSQSSHKKHDYHASKFRYDSQSDTVICPEGRHIPFQRTRVKRNRQVRVYRSAKTCEGCAAREKCTTDRHGRSIDLAEGHQQLREMDKALADRTNRHLLGYRKSIVEPVFAQIKAHGRFRRWTCFGLENARAQWAMLSATWNLKVIYKHWRESRNPNRSTNTTRSCLLYIHLAWPKAA